MKNMTIYLMNDGSLCDIDVCGTSLFELLPTITQIQVGDKVYSLNEESNEFINHYRNASLITIQLLDFQSNIEVEKMDW